MRKESLIMIVCLVILAIPVVYFLILVVDIFGSFLSLQNAHIIMDDSMNLILRYNWGQSELGSMVTFVFAFLCAIVFGLLVALFFIEKKKR